MRNTVITLSSHILIREEGNDVLLYNRQNDAVVRLSRVLFEGIQGQRDMTIEDIQRCFEILFTQNMLKKYEGDVKVVLNGSNSEKRSANLFDLQSEQSPFVLIWAMTSRCNLNCIYCFPNVDVVQPIFKTLPLSDWLTIADQIIAAKIFQVTLSGGEVLLEKDCFSVIDRLHRHHVKLCLITNGTTIQENIVERLKYYEVFVAVSLDGATEAINAKTRGKGVFEKTLQGIQLLRRANFPVILLITVHRYNFENLGALIQLADYLGIRHITLQDLRPFGAKSDYDALRLTVEQERKLFAAITYFKKIHSHIFFNTTELFIFPDSHRPNRIKNGQWMQCPAGYNLAYLDFYGDLYPCTHLPMLKMGNVIQDGSITQLWQSSPAIKKLREWKSRKLSDIPECRECIDQRYCDGGCRGDALFYTDDLRGLPSRCPRRLENYNGIQNEQAG